MKTTTIKKRELVMSVTESNLCLVKFIYLNDELKASKLLSKKECQYWIFERSYKAALEEMINNISIATNSQGKISLEEVYLEKKTSSN